MADDLGGCLFQSEIEYSGIGVARFASPSGRIEGPAVIHFDEGGATTIQIQVEELKTDEPMTHGLMELLSGRKMVREGRVVGHSFSMDREVDRASQVLDAGIVRRRPV